VLWHAADPPARDTTMNSIDVEVIRSAMDWMNRGHRVVMGTVVRTWGSSPRPPGSLMVIRVDGQVAGLDPAVQEVPAPQGILVGREGEDLLLGEAQLFCTDIQKLVANSQAGKR
jgi:hypothetical protein